MFHEQKHCPLTEGKTMQDIKYIPVVKKKKQDLGYQKIFGYIINSSRKKVLEFI